MSATSSKVASFHPSIFMCSFLRQSSVSFPEHAAASTAWRKRLRMVADRSIRSLVLLSSELSVSILATILSCSAKGGIGTVIERTSACFEQSLSPTPTAPSEGNRSRENRDARPGCLCDNPAACDQASQQALRFPPGRKN